MHILCLITCKVRSENGYGVLRPGLKTGVGNGIFWSEIWSGFGDAGGTPPSKIPRSTPPGGGGERPHASQRICVSGSEKAKYFDILLFFYSTSHLLSGVHTSVTMKSKPILWRVFDSLQNSRHEDMKIMGSLNQSVNQFPSLNRVRCHAPST